EVRPGDGIRAAEYLRQLVGPAGVPDDAVDRALHLVAAATQLGEFGDARLDHLREPVQDLAAVVGGRGRPAGRRGAGGADGVTGVLARGAGEVVAPRVVGAPGFAARKGAADEQLVRLLDGQAAHSSNLRYGSSPCSPPSRPKPDSL